MWTICYSWPAGCEGWGRTCSGRAEEQGWGGRGPAAPVLEMQWWRNQMLHPECAQCVCSAGTTSSSHHTIELTHDYILSHALLPLKLHKTHNLFKSMTPISLLQLLPVVPPTFSKSHDLLPHPFPLSHMTCCHTLFSKSRDLLPCPFSLSHVTCCHTHLFGVPQRVVIGQMHELVDQVRLVEVTG